MSEYSKAFVAGGFSENHKFLEGLADTISSGSYRIVDEAEPVTFADIRNNPDKFDNEAARRLVIAHSAGAMAVTRAGFLITLSGVEPTGLKRLIRGSMRVATNGEVGKDDTVAQPKAIDGPLEVIRHPDTLIIPLWSRHFSTLDTMIQNPGLYPDGRIYLQYDKDEFGFGANGEVEKARLHGIKSEMLDGYHCQALLHPEQSAKDISRMLNS